MENEGTVDKKELVDFLLRQKTVAYENGMRGLDEGNIECFQMNRGIVHFLEWFIYLKLEKGCFDVAGDINDGE